MYWIDESDASRGSSNQTAFYCDDVDDIVKLPTSKIPGVKQGEDTISCKPCGIGSSCLCIETSTLYVLNSHDQWKEL